MGQADDSCWVCSSADVHPWKSGVTRTLEPADFRITDANYGTTLPLQRCGSCGFVFADRASLASLTDLYEQMDDQEYVEGQTSRALQMQWMLRWTLERARDARTLVDVGSGAGLVVREAASLGLDATGIEPSRFLVEKALEVNGVRLLQGLFPHPELQGRKFDVVSLIDVIEHVSDPVQMLRDAAGAVADEGVVVVVTPNLGSGAARLLGKRWWHFRIAHVGYFDRSTFERAAAAAGLRIVDSTTAKWFFTVRYVAERLGQYLPVDGLMRRIDSSSLGHRLFDRIVTVNLFDSCLFLLRKSQAPGAR